jgi:hypothetical protein
MRQSLKLRCYAVALNPISLFTQIVLVLKSMWKMFLMHNPQFFFCGQRSGSLEEFYKSVKW